MLRGFGHPNRHCKVSATPNKRLWREPPTLEPDRTDRAYRRAAACLVLVRDIGGSNLEAKFACLTLGTNIVLHCEAFGQYCICLPAMAILRVAPSRAQQALNLLRTVNAGSSSCPCHSHSPGAHAHTHGPQPFLNPFAGVRRSLATPVDLSRQKEYAFEVAASSVRFGPGCTKVCCTQHFSPHACLI